MGKIRGIFQFTGKIGEAVGMKGDNGENYGRVRVRTIANPNTEGQQVTRTIASLAGKISAITPADVIKGMNGANKRQRRSRFMQNIMKKATTVRDVATGAYQAIIDPEKIILSEGQLMDLPTLTKSIASGVVTIAHTAWPEDLAALIIVCYGATQDDAYVECKHTVILPTDVSPATINMSKETVSATVYAIPVSRAEGASNTSYESALEALETNREFAVTSTSSARSALGYNQSSYEGGVQENA